MNVFFFIFPNKSQFFKIVFTVQNALYQNRKLNDRNAKCDINALQQWLAIAFFML
jgi:hypothetical protein